MLTHLFFNLFIGICIVVGGISTYHDGYLRGAPIHRLTTIFIIALGAFYIIYNIYKYYRDGNK